MLGDFLTRSLMLILGFVYPAFECYKAVEKKRVEIEELRFWCRYWITVAALTFVEKFADIFVSWLPLYREMKLGLVIYLWSSKTKGTNYIYEKFLLPYIAMYESDIDRNLMEIKTRASDLAMFYWRYFITHGQTTFYGILQSLAAQSTIDKENTTQKGSPQCPSPPSPKAKTSTDHQPDKQKTQSEKQRRSLFNFISLRARKSEHQPHETLSQKIEFLQTVEGVEGVSATTPSPTNQTRKVYFHDK